VWPWQCVMCHVSLSCEIDPPPSSNSGHKCNEMTSSRNMSQNLTRSDFNSSSGAFFSRTSNSIFCHIS
jgi:hypothetical protein